MTAAAIVQRTRAGVILLLVALCLLLSALPASADPRRGGAGPLNITWEGGALHSITWE